MVMDMEAYKQKAIVLLGEYHKREAQVKLLKIECQALEQLAPGVSAVSYDQMAAHTNKVASMVEGYDTQNPPCTCRPAPPLA